MKRQFIDDMDKMTVGTVWRLQNLNPDGYAWTYDGDAVDRGGDPLDNIVSAFRITGDPDSGRGVLVVADAVFGVERFPLAWRRSNLNRSGFWVLADNGHAIFRTRDGWRTGAQVRAGGGARYREQSRSRATRNGGGRFGALERLFSRADLADNWESDSRRRKLTYRGKATPFLRRTVKKMRKLGFQIPLALRELMT